MLLVPVPAPDMFKQVI